MAALLGTCSMSISPARMAAYQVLLRVETSRDFAVDLLQSSLVSKLEPVDRNLVTELVMGVLRWRGDLDFQIEQLSGKSIDRFDPEIAEALRLGAYQIRFLSRVPKRAAVHESVELVKAARKRSAAGLVNAVLRKFERVPLADPDSRDGSEQDREYVQSALRSLPEWIRLRWERNFGHERATAMVLASQAAPHTYLRLTDPNESRQALRQELAEGGVQTKPGAVGARSIQVESGDVFATDAWKQRRIVIQEEASQLVGELVQPHPGQTVLDVCAAPGIKAGQIAADFEQGSLVACDRNVRRMKVMQKLIASWPPNVRLHEVVLDASQPLPFRIRFDRVLADVPCSGTGTLARNPEIKWRLKEEDLGRLAQIQTEILRNSLSHLAPNGRLVYSTCSLEPEEDEKVIAKALESFPKCRAVNAADVRQEFPRLAAMFDERGYFRTWPGVHPLDGFFAAVITCG